MARILLVDDEKMILDALQLILRRAGHDVTAVTDSQSAIASQRQLPVDLVITDLVMAGNGGMELISEMRNTWPKLVIVALSGIVNTSSDDIAKLAIQKGADAVFSKPIDQKEFINALTQLLS